MECLHAPTTLSYSQVNDLRYLLAQVVLVSLPYSMWHVRLGFTASCELLVQQAGEAIS